MTFELIPAIDLLGGQVVRLERGKPGAKTVYSDDPVAVAKEWERHGVARIHVVDLDGAMEGEPRQHAIVEEIVGAVRIPVQVAGGIRTRTAAEHWVARGADRVVMGTAALTDLRLLEDVVGAIGARLVVAPDALGREVRVSGWTEGTGEDVVDACRRLAAAGVPRLLVTDIGVDGMLTGANVDLLREVAAATEVPVIASGGVACTDDLRALAEIPGIEGAIVGKALYSGAIDLDEALRVVAA